jgi:hypothetical protein
MPRSTEKVAGDELTLTWLGVIVMDISAGGVVSDCAKNRGHPAIIKITATDFSIVIP